jgi:hypothetical protein
MHDWGDEGVDWKGINDCCDILYNICNRYGRLGGQIKEKYGTVRFYASFGYLSLHTLIYPGYVAYQFPRWLMKLDMKVIGPTLDFFFGKLFIKWQIFIYKYAYIKCLKKYPHLKEEITCCMNHPELLK